MLLNLWIWNARCLSMQHSGPECRKFKPDPPPFSSFFPLRTIAFAILYLSSFLPPRLWLVLFSPLRPFPLLCPRIRSSCVKLRHFPSGEVRRIINDGIPIQIPLLPPRLPSSVRLSHRPGGYRMPVPSLSSDGPHIRRRLGSFFPSKSSSDVPNLHTSHFKGPLFPSIPARALSINKLVSNDIPDSWVFSFLPVLFLAQSALEAPFLRYTV